MGCCLLTSASVASQRATCKGPLKVRIDHGAALALSGICLAVSAPCRAEGGQEALRLQGSGAARTRISGNSSVSLASSLQAQKQTLCQSSLTFLYAGGSSLQGQKAEALFQADPWAGEQKPGSFGGHGTQQTAAETLRWPLKRPTFGGSVWAVGEVFVSIQG